MLDAEVRLSSTHRALRTALALLTAVATYAPSGAATSQSASPPAVPSLPDVQKLGPQPGERVPDFTLTDQQGRPRPLTSLLGPRGLMLVFFRSADW